MFRRMLIVAIATLSACSANPLKTAETTEQKADAAYGMFVIAQEAAVAIYQDPATPQSVRDALKNADILTKPLADGLHQAIVDFQEVMAAYKAAAADRAQLIEAERVLSVFLNRALTDINNYVATVNRFKKPPQPAPVTRLRNLSLSAVPA